MVTKPRVPNQALDVRSTRFALGVAGAAMAAMAAACLRGQIAAVGSVDAGGVRDAASLADVMASADASICVPGTRDPSFGVDGVIVLPARDTAVRCAALDRAGRLYVVRDDVERYTAAGVADGSWNPPEPASVHACVVDARNGLLVGTCSSTGCNRIRRLSADGTWDTSWGDGGSVDVPSGQVVVLALLGDGTIAAAATLTYSPDPSLMDYRGHAPALTRLSSMGQVLAGWQATLDGGLNEPGEATAIAPDLAGGVALGVGGLGKGSGPSLVDFGPDLSPRADFSDSSRVRVDSLARLSDGRLVALEESPPHYRRLLPDGAADPTFPPALPTLGSILSVDDEDRMVIGGNASVSRLLVDGALDDTFGDPVVLGAAAPRTGTTLFWAPQDNAEAGLLPLDLISFVSPASSGILLVAQRGSDWVLVRLCA